MDERGVNGVERGIRERHRADISLRERTHALPLSCDGELIRRDVYPNDEPACTSNRGQMQAATAPQLETSAWAWPEPGGD
jgi:hypothetical protein